MTKIILAGSADNTNSPFNEIRGFRADGTEYWTARELMKWLGYKSWQFGEKALNRAIKSLENQGFDTTAHVMRVHKLSNQYNNKVVDIEDYELSRFACYLAALKIRELIDRLERVEKIVAGSPHPNTDNVKLVIHFGDAEMDNRSWSVEIHEIDSNNRPGCGCEEDAIILLAVKEG